MRVAAAALAVLAGNSPVASAVAATTATAKDVSAELRPILDRHRIPGLTALALRGHEIIAQGAAGVRLAGVAGPITLGDTFHLGSDTKAMTATIAALFVDEGKLAWNTTLGDAFGSVAKDMHPAWRAVTLNQLLAHRAGLPANPAAPIQARVNRRGTSLSQQRREIVTLMLAQPPEYPPGTKFLYSNTGFMFAGAMIEQMAGLGWENVARTRLFQPLGITTGGFGAPTTSIKNDQPRGHHADGRPAAPTDDNPPFYGPAGTAHMALPDWAKFIALHLRGDPANPHTEARLVSASSFTHLHTPAPGEDYVGGWIATNRPWAKGDRASDRGRVLTHAGSNTLWYCVVWIAPEIDFAALAACNMGGDEAAKATDEAVALLVRQAARKSR